MNLRFPSWTRRKKLVARENRCSLISALHSSHSGVGWSVTLAPVQVASLEDKFAFDENRWVLRFKMRVLINEHVNYTFQEEGMGRRRGSASFDNLRHSQK